MIVACVWGMSLAFLLTCKARTQIEYEIRYDSITKETYRIKKEIQKIYNDLVSGVKEESYILMVLHNKERFAYKADMKVEWKNNALLIIEGDGKGSSIEGNLEAVSLCIPKVQPRSLFQRLFQ